ncbi:YqgE/AlgH family protein [Neokomagataea thailandica]|nr:MULTISPECIES: YqgE/AlgH family protein [Neokomagataea]
MTNTFSGHNENLTGKLLIAAPQLADTFFAQSVIYVCSHSDSHGAMGLIINKRVFKPSIGEIFSQLSIEPNPPKRALPLCLGGPVDHDRGFILHSADWQHEGGITVTDTTRLTANLDILKDIAAGKGPERAIMALGHASWSTGQLENEILKDSSWLVAPADQDLIFSTQYADKWRKALTSIQIDPLRLSPHTGEA